MSDDDDMDCPLCMEELDIADRYFRPCPCGYQICRFCWHHIKTNLNGRCPACRRGYSDQIVEFIPVSAEEVLRQKREKKEKDRQEREMKDRKQLSNVRVVQKNLVYVLGLSAKYASAENDFFKKYGKIIKLVVSKRANASSSTSSSVGIYVTYACKADAASAIDGINGAVCDGKSVRASYGTTKYCSYFLRHMNCPNPNCMYLHETGDDVDSYSKETPTVGTKHANTATSGNSFPNKRPTTSLSLSTSSKATKPTPAASSSETVQPAPPPVKSPWAPIPKVVRPAPAEVNATIDPVEDQPAEPTPPLTSTPKVVKKSIASRTTEKHSQPEQSQLEQEQEQPPHSSPTQPISVPVPTALPPLEALDDYKESEKPALPATASWAASTPSSLSSSKPSPVVTPDAFGPSLSDALATPQKPKNDLVAKKKDKRKTKMVSLDEFEKLKNKPQQPQAPVPTSHPHKPADKKDARPAWNVSWSSAPSTETRSDQEPKLRDLSDGTEELDTIRPVAAHTSLSTSTTDSSMSFDQDVTTDAIMEEQNDASFAPDQSHLADQPDLADSRLSPRPDSTAHTLADPSHEDVIGANDNVDTAHHFPQEQPQQPMSPAAASPPLPPANVTILDEEQEDAFGSLLTDENDTSSDIVSLNDEIVKVFDAHDPSLHAEKIEQEYQPSHTRTLSPGQLPSPLHPPPPHLGPPPFPLHHQAPHLHPLASLAFGFHFPPPPPSNMMRQTPPPPPPGFPPPPPGWLPRNFDVLHGQDPSVIAARRLQHSQQMLEASGLFGFGAQPSPHGPRILANASPLAPPPTSSAQPSHPSQRPSTQQHAPAGLYSSAPPHHPMFAPAPSAYSPHSSPMNNSRSLNNQQQPEMVHLRREFQQMQLPAQSPSPPHPPPSFQPQQNVPPPLPGAQQAFGFQLRNDLRAMLPNASISFNSPQTQTPMDPMQRPLSTSLPPGFENVPPVQQDNVRQEAQNFFGEFLKKAAQHHRDDHQEGNVPFHDPAIMSMRMTDKDPAPRPPMARLPHPHQEMRMPPANIRSPMAHPTQPMMMPPPPPPGLRDPHHSPSKHPSFPPGMPPPNGLPVPPPHIAFFGRPMPMSQPLTQQQQQPHQHQPLSPP